MQAATHKRDSAHIKELFGLLDSLVFNITHMPNDTGQQKSIIEIDKEVDNLLNIVNNTIIENYNILKN